MQTKRQWSLYPVIALMALAFAACSPKEGPAERAGKAVDNAFDQAAAKAEQAGDKVKKTVEDAKK